MELEDWIVEADISGMQQAMESGLISSERLAGLYLERIGKFDGPLNSILEINPDAVSIAKVLDAERKETGARGPLHGIPILLKDNMDTEDRLHTSAGSLALADSLAAADSWVASRLRAEGAVILGKTNMTEWAGYSARAGLTRNPYGPGELFVGGSSSGAAVATAGNLAAAALGTETSGSIISPSSLNGLVGIKPTVGLISRAGIIPLALSQDTPGPIARTVTDAALLLGALTGKDEQDPMTSLSEGRFHRDYTAFLERDGLLNARIGIPRFYYKHLDEARLALVEKAIRDLRDAGAVIVDPVSLPCEGTQWNKAVFKYEFKKGLNDYLSKLSPSVPVHSLQELIDFNLKHAEAALKYGQDLLVLSDQTSGTLMEPEYLEGVEQNRIMARVRGIDYVLQEHRLDALLFLGAQGGADLAARAGYPSITVPAGRALSGVIAPGGYNTKGLQGITFVGTAYSEPALIRLAYAYEQAARYRVPPCLTSL